MDYDLLKKRQSEDEQAKAAEEEKKRIQEQADLQKKQVDARDRAVQLTSARKAEEQPTGRAEMTADTQSQLKGRPGTEPQIPTMATPPVPTAAPVDLQMQPVPPADQTGSTLRPYDRTGTTTGQIGQGQEVKQKAVEIAKQAAADPKVGNQLLDLAKNTGKSILELIQGFAVGYSRSNIPLASMVRREQENIDKDRAQKEGMQRADQDFQVRLAQIQADYQNRLFQAQTEADKQKAKEEYDFRAQQAQKDREAQVQIAQIGRQPTVLQQQSRQASLGEQLQKVAASLRGGG